MSSSNNSADGVVDVVKRTIEDIRDMSDMQQIFVGGATGLATGYLLSRVGKLAAFAIGSGVLALQVAQHLGYIEVRWGKRSRIEDLKKKAIQVAEETGVIRTTSKTEKLSGDVKRFVKQNVTFAVSFGGGFLIGFSF